VVGVRVEDFPEGGVVRFCRAAVVDVPHAAAALMPGGVFGWLVVLDDPRCQEVLTLGDACPDDLGCELALTAIGIRGMVASRENLGRAGRGGLVRLPRYGGVCPAVRAWGVGQ
jgi:hypothetical protein